MTNFTRVLAGALLWLIAFGALAPHTTRGTIDPQLVETVAAQP